MIVPPAGVRVLVATRPVDFRKGMDGLAALAKETLGQDPFSGAILVFRAKRADRVKLLLWDGTGLMLVSKRLEQGAFKWPPIMDGVMRLSSREPGNRHLILIFQIVRPVVPSSHSSPRFHTTRAWIPGRKLCPPTCAPVPRGCANAEHHRSWIRWSILRPLLFRDSSRE